MASSRSHLGFLAIVTLVALRVLIGIQFLCAGIEKLNPEFSSAGFLRAAKGPLAEYYHSLAPEPHDWDKLVTEPFPPAENFEESRVYLDRDNETKRWITVEKRTRFDAVGHIPHPTEAYGAWASRVAEDWHADLETFQALPGVDDEQEQAAESLFLEQYSRLAGIFEENREEIAKYHHEAERLAEMQRSDATGSLDYLDERIAKKKADVAAMPRPWVAAVAAQENVFHKSLEDIFKKNQTGSAAKLVDSLNPPTTLDTIDSTVRWLTLIVGGCLIVGLFTRLAAITGAGFLLAIISTQPPWVEGIAANVKLLVVYQGIEFLALLLLAFIGAGAWAGLDRLIWGAKTDT